MKNRIEICGVGRWQFGALLALCCLVSGAWLLAADWPTFRNASNAGASPETINLPLTEVWHSTAPLVEENGVVVANGIAYMMSDDGQLYAFTVSTGFAVAGFPVVASSTFGTPAVDVANGRIYVLAGGQLWGFNLNGTSAFPPINVGSLGTNYNQGPILDGGFVYFQAGGMLHKYNSLGVAQWTSASPGDNTQPAISGNFVYKNTEAGQIRKFDKVTGVEVVTGGFPITTTSSQASLAVVNGRIFHKTDELRVYNATTGVALWNQPIGGDSTFYNSPAVANGAVYVYGWDSRLYAFNEITGATLAGFPSIPLGNNADRNWSSPAVAGDKVFVGAATTQRLKVVGAAGSAQAGLVLEEHLTFSTDTQGFDLCSPVVSDGYVFAMLDGGGLYAFFAGTNQGALLINGGAACTNSQNVTLTIDNNNNPDITEMRISEDPFFTGASFIPYQHTFPFTLSAGFGTKTVYAQLRDNAGILSNVFNDQISYQATCQGTPTPTPTSTPTPTPTATPTPTPTPTPTVRAQEAYVKASKRSVRKGRNAAFIVALDPGPAAQPVTVNYSMSGSATLDTDYTLSGTPGQVTIPAGQSSARVILHALRKVKKAATMTLTRGQGYFLSGRADDVATIRIRKK